MGRVKGAPFAGAECPECGSLNTPGRVGGYDLDNRRIRQRRCADCTRLFVTVEVPVLLEDGQPIPYSWLDEFYRLRQREAARKRHTRKGGGKYRGLKTKKPIEGVASLDVKVQVWLADGMRPDTRHGTAEPIPRLSNPSIAPQRLVSEKERIRIAEAYGMGVPTTELARAYRISVRTVQRYVERYGKVA